MEQFGPYTLIIAASLILLISFLFDAVAKRTNIPSVLMLIGLGVGIQYLLAYLGAGEQDLFPVLEVLGILGLIMIVLEAALDLKLSVDKIGTIIKSFMVALIGLGASFAASAFIIHNMIPGLSWPASMLYATPLSILSSAIIIPSVRNLSEEKREFHVYESTFSDIMGIILFYFLIQYFESEAAAAEGLAGGNPFGSFTLNLILTILIALIASYLILFIFQRIRSDAKLFVLISVLLLLYALAKTFHLSPLIIILVFGLTVSNSKLFFRGPLQKMLDPEKFKEMEHGLHGLTAETAFVVRTFFFVIFGASILISSLYNLDVIVVSLVLVVSIFIIRLIVIKIFIGKDIVPQVWIAPRGLITVLLFYAIPPAYQSELFDPGILLFIILATGILMSYGLILNSISKGEAGEEVIKRLPGTAYTISVDPETSSIRKWVIGLRSFFKRRIIHPITSHRTYRRYVSSLKIMFLKATESLGVKPIFTSESRFFKRRLRSVIRLIRNPDGVPLDDNPDYKALKKYVWKVLFRTDTLEGILFDILIFSLIVISVAIVMIQSVSGLPVFWQGLLFTVEILITIIFTVEYALRIWTSKHSRKYVLSTFGIIDLFAILPLFLEVLFEDIISLGVIRLFRLLRIFRVLKLARFLGEANVLSQGIKENINKIFVFIFFVIIICTIMGSFMFVIEGPENGFTSIPRGVYWAVVTLTTVGYGDIAPATPIGQFISMVIMILGYGVIAVPAGLVAAGTANAMRKNNDKARSCSRCKSPITIEGANYCNVCGDDLTKQSLPTEGVTKEH